MTNALAIQSLIHDYAWAQDVRNVVNNEVFKMDYSVFISRWLSNCVLRTTSDEIKA